VFAYRSAGFGDGGFKADRPAEFAQLPAALTLVTNHRVRVNLWERPAAYSCTPSSASTAVATSVGAPASWPPYSSASGA
jgi:hypothetical protein